MKKGFLFGSVGHLIVLICFFLPWIEFKCMGSTRTVSGKDIGEIFWLVFGLSLLSILVLFILQHERFKASVASIAFSASSLLIILYKYFEFSSSGIDTGMGGKITAKDVGFSIAIGGYGTLVGLLAAIIGSMKDMSSDEPTTEQSVDSSNLENSSPNYNPAIQTNRNTATNANRFKQLILSIENNDIEEIKAILRIGDLDVNSQLNGVQPLITAIQKAIFQTFETLYLKGADLNYIDQDGDSIIVHAIKKKNKELVEWLLNKDVKLDTRNVQKFTPLMVAMQIGNNEITDLLFNKKPEISTDDARLLCYLKEIDAVKYIHAKNMPLDRPQLLDGLKKQIEANNQGAIECYKLLGITDSEVNELIAQENKRMEEVQKNRTKDAAKSRKVMLIFVGILFGSVAGLGYFMKTKSSNISPTSTSSTSSSKSSTMSPSYTIVNPPASGETGIVTSSDALYMRDKPSKDAKREGGIPTGAEVKVIDSNGPEETLYNIKSKWIVIEYKGKKAWVFGGFVEKK